MRGMYDGVDWDNFKDRLLSKGYKQLKCQSQGLFDGIAWVDFQGENGKFRFEYDDWFGLDFYPEDPANVALVDELNRLVDEFELIGSSNESYKEWHVSSGRQGERKRLI